jgi:hypothetical protein
MGTLRSPLQGAFLLGAAKASAPPGRRLSGSQALDVVRPVTPWKRPGHPAGQGAVMSRRRKSSVPPPLTNLELSSKFLTGLHTEDYAGIQYDC